MAPVPSQTEHKETAAMFEERVVSSLEEAHGEKIFMIEEVGHRKVEVRTFEEGVELWESSQREECTLRKEIRQQVLISKDKEEVLRWYSEDQKVKLPQPLEDTESANTAYEDNEPSEEEDKALYLEEEIPSQRSLLPEVFLLQSKIDITHPPDRPHPMKKKVPSLETGLTSKKEVVAYQKRFEERNLKEAHVPSSYPEQREVIEISEDIVTPPMTTTLKEVTLLEQVDPADLQKAASQPPGEKDLPKTLPKSSVSIRSKRAMIPPKMMESPIEDIKGRSLEHIIPLEKQTPVSEEVIPKEEFVQSKTESSLLQPDKTLVKHQKEFMDHTKSSTTSDLLPRKDILKNGVAPTIDSQVIPQKKPPPSTRETIPSKKSTSSAQREVAPAEEDSSEEARTIGTEHSPTGEDVLKSKTGTQKTEQQTLQKGIILYLS